MRSALIQLVIFHLEALPVASELLKTVLVDIGQSKARMSAFANS